MTNPFGEPEDFDKETEILEGFICPICHTDQRSLEFLTDHFERAHAEEQDVLKTIFKDLFSKAKKTMGLDNNNDVARSLEKNAKTSSSSASTTATSNAHRSAMNVYNFMGTQEIGVTRCHIDYFKEVRNPRLERYASETNKLIIRLNKLLKDMPTDSAQRKQHEQSIVTWLDGSSVKLCPNCAKKFNLGRRQHHCRLCGSIMCNDCSEFLSIDIAKELASITFQNQELQAGENESTGSNTSKSQPDSIRCCAHCIRLLETRQEMHESRTCNPPIAQLYAKIQEMRKEVIPKADTLSKIIISLNEGESIFTLADATRLRGKIGQIAEAIDLVSKRIMTLPTQQGSRAEALKKAIRLACVNLIKDKLLTLPPLPKEEEIRAIQERKVMETRQRIETERRMAAEAYERYGLQRTANHISYHQSDSDYAVGSNLQTLDNWSAHSSATRGGQLMMDSDPLVEQINIIKGYIKQARQEFNFDVVETLELNLRDLQQEYYQRQRASVTVESDSSKDKGSE